MPTSSTTGPPPTSGATTSSTVSGPAPRDADDLRRDPERRRRVPSMPEARRMARAGRPGEGRPLRGPAVLGTTGARVRRPSGARPRPRARAGRTRRQPDGADLHGRSFGGDGALRAVAASGHSTPRPRPRFGHGVEASVGPYRVLGCFHPSQQNTFTGKLTPAMLDDVLRHSRALAHIGGSAE